MYITRKIEKIFKEALNQFPACLITGCRQSGKSTLLQHLLKEYEYVSFDNAMLTKMAKDDPELFLNSHKPPVIFDEIQYAPELLPYIKIRIDQDRRSYGRYVFTGSQSFQLMQGISESLAGRIAIFNLYPFSFEEIDKNLSNDQTLESCLKGFYPEFYLDLNLNTNVWYGSYLTTYVERDIRNIKSISDLSRFQSFINILATRAGQILNLSNIAKEVGVTQPTCKSWLSILESTYIIHLLKPYYKNRKKRIIKSPKLYFVDTGLLCFLLGIDTPQRLLKASESRAIFENLVIMDVIKRLSYQTTKINTFFYRSQSNLEVDLLLERGQELIAIEIKFAKTVSKEMINNLRLFQKDHPYERGFLASLSDKDLQFQENIYSINFKDIPLTIEYQN